MHGEMTTTKSSQRTPHPTVIKAMRESGMVWEQERQTFRPMTQAERDEEEGPGTERRPGIQQGNLSDAAFAAERAAMGLL